MKKYVPPGKMSKRKKKELYAARRGDWNGVNPATKIIPNGKIYSRKKSELRYEHEPRPDFFMRRSPKPIYNCI